MVQVVFQRPVYLWFLLSVLLLVLIHFYTLKHARRKALRFANFEAIARVTGEKALSKNIFLLFVRVVALTFAVLAVAGTVVWYTGQTSEASFVLAIDASSSMRADDFLSSRLEAAKQEALRFVDSVGRLARIGVLSFSGTVFIEQDMSSGHLAVKRAINAIQVKTVGGTDIGGAIVDAANLLRNEPKGRVLIVLTDGRSNVGVSLQEAVDYANRLGVTIHTIGVGTAEGGQIEGVDLNFILDEAALQLVSAATQGRFFKVGTVEGLGKAYEEIAALTEQRLSVDVSPLLMLLAVLLLFVEWVLVNTKYSILP